MIPPVIWLMIEKNHKFLVMMFDMLMKYASATDQKALLKLAKDTGIQVAQWTLEAGRYVFNKGVVGIAADAAITVTPLFRKN